MPTYGCEDLPEPQKSSEAPQGVLEAMKRVRDACGIDMDDETLSGLVNTALEEYRRGR